MFGGAFSQTPFGGASSSGFGAAGAPGVAVTNSAPSAFGSQPQTGPGANGQSGFGQTPFGSTNAQSGFGGFSSTQQGTGNAFSSNATSSPFGSSQRPATGGGLFGAKPATSSLFGSQPPSTSSGGLFGQQTQPQSTGLFGQPNPATAQPATSAQNTSTGLFGASSNSGGLFGSQNNTGSTNSGSLFGQQQPAIGGAANTNSAPLFGQSQNTITSNSSNLFGAPQNSSLFNKPTGFTGATNTASTGLFGQSNTNPSSNFNSLGTNNNVPGTGIFGQSNATTQPTNYPFSSNSTSVGSSLFGSKPPGTNTGFGTSIMPSSGLFGQNNSNVKPPGAGLFSSQPSTNSSGGLFGNTTVGANSNGPNQIQQPNNGGSLFGTNSSNPMPSQTGTSLFGAKASGPASTNSNMFGNNTTGQPPQNSTGLFGTNTQTNMNKPIGFGGSSNTSTGLFGGSSSLPATNTTQSNMPGNNNSIGIGGAGIFSAKNNSLPGNNNTTANNMASSLQPAASTSSTGLNFGSNSNTKPNVGNSNQGASLFGNHQLQSNTLTQGGLPSQTGTQQWQQQQSFQTPSNVISNPVLFSNIPMPNSITNSAKASSVKVNADEKYKSSLTSAYRLAPKPLFSPEFRMNRNQEFLGLSHSQKTKGNVFEDLDLLKKPQNNSENIITPAKLLFNPDQRSLKQLVIDKSKKLSLQKEDTELKVITIPEANMTISTNSSPINASTTPIKKGSLYDTAIVEAEPIVDGPTLDQTPTKITVHELAHRESSTSKRPHGILSNDYTFLENLYYITPSLETLKSEPLEKLRKVDSLIVGHSEYGKIEFLEPVDLTLVPIDKLCGDIIEFGPRSISVYPKSNTLPKAGEGINVRARITLYGCFPHDKSTKEPIKDVNNPIMKRHITLLRKSESFVSFDPVTGRYTFEVQNPIASI